MQRLTYKSPHGGYGYNQDVDFYSNEVKEYIGRLEDMAEMTAVSISSTRAKELRKKLGEMFSDSDLRGSIENIKDNKLAPEEKQLNVPAIHGKWLQTTYREDHHNMHHCSVCGVQFPNVKRNRLSDCPNCGAKMDSVERI